MKKYQKLNPLPKSYNAVKQLDKAAVAELWPELFGANAPDFTTVPYRMIWHRIQMMLADTKIEQRHITKLNRYACDPDGCIGKSIKTKYILKPGGTIVKTYKGRKYTVRIIDHNRFEYMGNFYPNLSQIVLEITGIRMSGPDFFGLNNKRVNDLTSEPVRA